MPVRHDLPSTYYRVSIKALVFEEAQRLLVFQGTDGEGEIPGGGLDHNEVVEDCLRRELGEEVGAKIASIDSRPEFLYVDHRPPGYYKLSIAFKVAIEEGTLTPQGDDLVAYAFVDKQRFLELQFQNSEKSVKTRVEQIWSTS